MMKWIVTKAQVQEMIKVEGGSHMRIGTSLSRVYLNEMRDFFFHYSKTSLEIEFIRGRLRPAEGENWSISNPLDDKTLERWNELYQQVVGTPKTIKVKIVKDGVIKTREFPQWELKKLFGDFDKFKSL